MEFTAWVGCFAPAGTPKAIIAKLNAEIVKIMHSQAMQDRLHQLGIEAIGSTPEQLAAHVKSETIKWANIAKRSGM